MTAALLSATAGAGLATAETARFASTGAEQTFTVPVGVTSLQVTVVGARGGGLFGGFGAVVRATLPVAPGQALFVEVGGSGGAGDFLEGLDDFNVGEGGFNGGASGGRGSFALRSGDGGGGATDVRSFSRTQPSSLGTRLAVAAGGGGGGGDGTSGGAAGSAGSTGAHNTTNGPDPLCTGGRGGSPGTATAGGTGGAQGTLGLDPYGAAGTDGQLGEAGTGGGDAFGGGGGGGGGLFGGGGGASGAGSIGITLCRPGGGAGGSSGFAPSATGTSVAADTSGVASVAIEWTAARGPGGPGNPGGPGGPGESADVVAPRLGAVALSSIAFIAANVGPSAVAAARAASVGTTVSYRLSEAARVSFAVERAGRGIRRNGRCVRRPARPVAGARRCTRWTLVRGGFAQDGAAGTNRIRFMGRLRGRALSAGSYRLVTTARDAAGNATARPARRSFRIVRG